MDFLVKLLMSVKPAEKAISIILSEENAMRFAALLSLNCIKYCFGEMPTMVLKQ